MQTDPADQAPFRKCVKCGQTTAKAQAYTCYLGKKASLPRTSLNGQTVSATYTVKGSHTDNLCHKCVVKSGLSTIIGTTVLLIVSAAIFYFAYMSAGSGSALAAGVCGITGLAALGSAIVIVYNIVLLVIRKYDGIGTALLIEICKKQYQPTEVDTYWRPAEYKKLRFPKS